MCNQVHVPQQVPSLCVMVVELQRDCPASSLFSSAAIDIGPWTGEALVLENGCMDVWLSLEKG